VELKERQNEVKSVAEEDALRKLLVSDEDEDDEQVNNESEKDKNEDDDGKERDDKVSFTDYFYIIYR